MSSYLEMLEKEELQLLQTLSVNRESQKKIHIENWEKEHGIKLNERINFISNGKIIEGHITDFEFVGCKVWNPICSKLNRDGSIGKYKQKIYKSEIKTLKKSCNSVNKYI